MSIRNWPESERPREKLLKRGAKYLSDAELLAVFLRTGTQGRSAVELARDLLSHFGDISAIFSASQREFVAFPGLGGAKYAMLQAVLELVSRHMEASVAGRHIMDNAVAVKAFLRLHLGGEAREVFGLLLLDSQHRCIRYESLFWGSISSASVYPRELVRRVLDVGAAAVIAVHNHPSGDPTPSREDVALTEQLCRALRVIEVALLDHFVVTHNEVVSFAERGIMPK